MREITKKSIHDEDINLDRIENRLIEISAAIKSNNKNNLTDINIICEEIFGKILNRLYNLKLISLSAEVSGNYIAVDLVDSEKKIAYQVTSQDTKAKIDTTIEKFNNSGLYDEYDELHFLILDVIDHKYRGNDIITLKNGKSFSYSKNIINFNDLIRKMREKNDSTNRLYTAIYDDINMLYDSGRLRYNNIVKETSLFKRFARYKLCNTEFWEKGYGDVYLSAFIPKDYKEKLCCMIQFRKYNVESMYIILDQEELIEEYFVTEERFDDIHNIWRNSDEEEGYIQLGNVRISINGHTAYNVFRLFDELRQIYYNAQKEINKILGTEKFIMHENKYLLMSIEKQQWKEMHFFAEHHDCFDVNGDIEWNIFNMNCGKTKIILSPNENGKIDGNILAELSVIPCDAMNNILDLYWEPGTKVNESCMDFFDNVVKWKADFTEKWIKEKFLPKAHRYYKKQKLLELMRPFHVLCKH